MRPSTALRRRRRPRASRSAGGIARSLAVAALLLGGAQAQEWSSGFGRGRLFSLPRSQDDIFEWKQAQRDLTAGRVDEAVDRLLRLLRNGQAGVVPLDERDERYMGLQAAVFATLRTLSAEGRLAYDKLTQVEAGSLVRTAFDGLQREQLSALAAGFPGSTAGQRARLRLGDLALEAGRGIEAELHFRAALDGLPEDAPQRAAVQRRMRAAQLLSQSAPNPAPDELDRQIEHELSGVLPGGVPASRPGGWSAFGGGSAGRGIMDEPLGDLQREQQIEIRARGFYERRYPMHAVGDITGIIVNDGLVLHCIDPLTGDTLWEAPGPLVGDPREDAEEYERGVNQDIVLAAACTSEIVVGALQVPNPSKPTRFRSIDVIRKLPRRRLFAVDRASGKRLWSHWDRLEGPLARRFDGHDAAGPPLIFGDTVYIGSHDQTGAIAYYLSAYDLRTGELRWRQLVCSSQGEVNMFGNSRREFAASPLAIADGIVLGATNLGVAFAADAATGRIRWVTAYEVIPLPETRLTDQQDRQVIFANNSIAVAGGVMACTPLDSLYALGFDVEDGTPQWRLDFRAPDLRTRNDIRWLLGAVGDEFVFSGLGVIAVKARSAKRGSLQPTYRTIRSPQSLGFAQELHASAHAVPRGALTKDGIYYAARDGLQTFSSSGDALLGARLTGSDLLGNLLLIDGILVSLRDGALEVFYDRTKLVQDAEQRVNRNRDDPSALLRLASLVRGGAGAPSAGFAAAERAEGLYRRALELAHRTGMGQDSPTYRRIATELFQLGVERAERLHATQPAKALEVMRDARDAALQPDQWLRAQRAILAWLQSTPEYLAELQRMAELHGQLIEQFDGIGRVPVAAYVLWQTAERTEEPAQAVRCCQELLENFPEVALGERLAQDAAREKQGELIALHGREVYATIEASAQAALARAAGDPELLRSIGERYPHSRAAAEAMRAMMDLAVERGDLGAAASGFAKASAEGTAGAGVYRRMWEAARVAGNAPLAAELARRLLAAHAAEASDFPPDQGRAIRDVVAAPADAAPPPLAAVERPLEIIASRTVGPQAIAVRVCTTRIADGFAPPTFAPLFASIGSSQLEAYDATRGADMFRAPLFSVPFEYHEGDDLLLCGDVVVLPELDRVRGIDLRTGAVKWALRADAGRMLLSLGCQAGVLHLFSELHGKAGSDGGIVIGVEPLTGAILFRLVFPKDAESYPPASSGGALWLFRPGREYGSVIVRHDPLTGRVTHRVPLSAPLLRRLDLDEPDSRFYLARSLHKRIFADDDTVYVPVEGGDRAPPRLAALAFDGTERFRVWQGEVGRSFEMVALRGDRLVLIESGPRDSRLLELDKTSGATRREMVLGSGLLVRNWSWSEHTQPAPDVLMLVDNAENVEWNLTCYSLATRIPSFAYRVNRKYAQLVDTPVLGQDFLAFAARSHNNQLELFVLDLTTRRSVLPGGNSTLRLPLERPFKMQLCGPHVAVQSAEGISIMGDPEKAPK